MTLQEVIKIVDELSPQERFELRVYLDQQPVILRPTLSPQERVIRLDAAAKAIRAGFTETEWASIEHDMTTEYVEAVDEDIWRD